MSRIRVKNACRRASSRACYRQSLPLVAFVTVAITQAQSAFAQVVRPQVPVPQVPVPQVPVPQVPVQFPVQIPVQVPVHQVPVHQVPLPQLSRQFDRPISMDPPSSLHRPPPDTSVEPPEHERGDKPDTDTSTFPRPDSVPPVSSPDSVELPRPEGKRTPWIVGTVIVIALGVGLRIGRRHRD